MFFAPLPHQPIALCVIALVIVAAGSDIESRRIPNLLIAAGLIAALAVQVWLQGFAAGAGAWLAGAVTGFAVLLPFYWLRGMAAGDVKLLMMIGAWVGPPMTCDIALSAFIAGGVWALAVTAYRRRLGRLLRNVTVLGGTALHRGGYMRDADAPQVESVGSLPYGVAIAAGTLWVLFVSAV